MIRKLLSGLLAALLIASPAAAATGSSGNAPPTFVVPDFIAYESVAAATNNQTLAGAPTWNTLNIDTVQRNLNSIGSLATNAVTLPAGSYWITYSVKMQQGSSYWSQLQLYNNTDAAIVDTSEFGGVANASSDGACQTMTVSAPVTITGSKAFIVRMQTASGNLVQCINSLTGATSPGRFGTFSVYKVPN